jgi:IS605 OrfB family transposase
MKLEDCFKVLPMKVATATIIQIQKNYKSFFKSIIDYGKYPNKYKSKPEQPNYLHKTNGRFIISYNYQAISKKVFKKVNKIKLSGTNIEFYTKITDFESIDCVRIIPRLDQYIIEVCYTFNEKKQIRDNKRYGSIDLGINNIATFTSNIKDIQPLIFNGRPLKSINQYYNKKLALIKSTLEKVNKKKSSNKLRKLTNKRNNKIDNYLHKVSKEIVKTLINNDISKLVIGKNDGWKVKSNISKRSNQNFIQIPHSRFIRMIQYKCEKEGIRVLIQEESYTSKASFLNLDIIPIYDKNKITKYEFSGYRKSRGLYKINNSNKVINSDVNGSYNILRKAIPNAFVNGIEDFVVNPKVINLTLN